MATDNDRRVIIFIDEVKELIQNELTKFSEVAELFVKKREIEENWSEKPMTIKEVADRYGVSRQTVNEWMKKGLITGFKQGKGRYFYRHELDKGLRNYKQFQMLRNTGQIPKEKKYVDFLREND